MPTPAKRKTPSSLSASKPPPKRPSTSAAATKSKPANGNILSFFKKVDGPLPPPKNHEGNGDLRKFGFTKGPRPSRNVGGLFFLDDDGEGVDPDLYSTTSGSPIKSISGNDRSSDDDMTDLFGPAGTQEQREALEIEEIEDEGTEEGEAFAQPETACTPPPPLEVQDSKADSAFKIPMSDNTCPFTFDDDPIEESPAPLPLSTEETSGSPFSIERTPEPVPVLKSDTPWVPEDILNDDDFIEDEGMENFDEEQEGRWKDAEDDEIDDEGEDVGEEKMNRRYMEQQELDEVAFLESLGPMDESGEDPKCLISCPICDVDLGGYGEDVVSRHVNSCLDGNPVPLPPRDSKGPVADKTKPSPKSQSFHPPRPAQSNPFATSATNTAPSAFSKIMAANAEDRAWKAAADEEVRSRGKRAFQRTCPFYKILPNLSVAVDAFRYGAVEGTNAYFLSHFHSDHYIGLSSSWDHGPIYCSRVTANLCRRQLRVDPQYIRELEYEKRVEIPGTGGATVTMIDANHCPGSSLFLFEKHIDSPRGRRLQRILHCGDFRASAKHLRHPLLNVARRNRIDICYLDTTYLNPKYAFPPQRQVIDACMELCVSLDKETGEGREMGFGDSRKEGGGIEKFTVSKTGSMGADAVENENVSGRSGQVKTKGKLLVVVGTYSIGKERICMGIAQALNCKIYAPTNKQRICAALEDSELNSRLTNDPYAAQVHMTPLMEIRPETLKDYLFSFKQRFTKIVGFRPSGWNYRPPNSRFVESPAVQTVLHSHAWRSDYGVAQMVPQRGSTADVKCFGVPYSEHSSFRELTAFCCALDIARIIPTVK
ncbi:hypothetical protein ABW19_dt0209728 [Dactylella cylindrospora]|nr:hypothetical protein ABW19_dt0209728 [Dactylella cylindrospora]